MLRTYASLLSIAALSCATAPATPAPASAPPPAPASAAPASGPPAAPAPAPAPAATPAGPASLTWKALPLPGATAPVTLDYLAYDAANGRVWVPVGDTASVDVLDVAAQTWSRVDGFKTAEREMQGRKRVMGPSAASAGDGFVFVGDRATGEVCPVDSRKLTLGKCLKLSSPTDGVAYVASAREVWVTTPRDRSITVLDATRPEALASKTVVRLDGSPEGYAVDDARGLFFTNLEDKDRTLVIDVRGHKPVGGPYHPDCGEAGPRGIAVDSQHDLVFVACTDHVVVLDRAHEGARAATIDTGAGVDNIDWLPARRLLFVGAARARRLTVAHVDEQGHATIVASGETPEGARNPVADSSGTAYEADPANARVLVFSYPAQ
ncbi:MAG TPA: hypothetical protein VKU41_09225 [Polyangiaceae bacterium]|nr:hypothetical protein [Polyangiaceae bacterium]